MAITLPVDSRRVISVEEYVDYVRSIDLRDVESLAVSAPMLRALANDRTLVVRQLNQEVENSFRTSSLPSAQTLYLGGGPGFYVRAAVWPSTSAITGNRVYQEKFSYHIAHDHNFTFLTVNYLGPGYETEIYEYDCESVHGYAGEPVDLKFLEKVRFGQGTVMLYRANRDVHIQYPPEELTVTLNLMISLPEVRIRDQYYFDVVRRTILDYPADSDSSKRVALVRLAGHIGDATTRELLGELAKGHPCARTRLTAFESLAQHRPGNESEIWEMACRDGAPLVAKSALRKLESAQ